MTSRISEKILNENKSFYYGSGCEHCHSSGYKGRLVINEVLVVDEDIRSAILLKASAEEIKKIAVKNGMKTMLEDGISKAIQGHTSIEEVLRVMSE